MRKTADPAAAARVPAAGAWPWVFAAWLVATAATLGALFLSEVMGIAPCLLCWYQRIFMFPLVLVLAAGLFPLDAKVVRYALPLAGGGWLVAMFHLLLTYGVVPERATPCSQGIPCSQAEIVWFGFVSIQLLSVLAFSAIVIVLVVARFKARP